MQVQRLHEGNEDDDDDDEDDDDVGNDSGSSGGQCVGAGRDSGSSGGQYVGAGRSDGNQSYMWWRCDLSLSPLRARVLSLSLSLAPGYPWPWYGSHAQRSGCVTASAKCTKCLNVSWKTCGRRGCRRSGALEDVDPS